MKEFKLRFLGLFVVLFPLAAMAAEKYSLEVRDAPVANVIRLLAHMEAKNVVIPGDLQGNVTASFPVIQLNDALSSILVSNDLVASLTNGVLQITTKRAQETLGKDLTTVTIHLKYAKARDVWLQAKALVAGRGIMLVDDRTNSITIHGTEDQIKSVRSLVENIDKLDKQVLIEAKIVAVSKSFSRDLGIQWGVNGTAGFVTVNGSTSAGTGQNGRPLNLAAAAPSPISGLVAALGPFGNTYIDVELSAGEVNGDVAFLARPSIVTMNNQPATIRSGLKFFVRTAGSVSISSGSTGTSGTSSAPTSATNSTSGSNSANAPASGVTTSSTLQEIDSGVTLVITPQITPDNKISLVINVISSQLGSTTVDAIPSINDNTATTTVLLEDGATTVIGGLAQLQNTDSTDGLPWLARLPLIGGLFGKSASTKSKSELLIFITPTVMKEAIKQLKGFNEKNLNKDEG